MKLRIIREALPIVAVVLTLCVVGLAQGDKINSIDATMNKCLETHKANMQRVGCYNQASEAWDKDVEAKYAALQKLLPVRLAAAFTRSQSTWEKYRDAHLAFLDAKDAKQTGTGHIAGRIIERMEVVKQRAMILDDLYDEYRP